MGANQVNELSDYQRFSRALEWRMARTGCSSEEALKYLFNNGFWQVRVAEEEANRQPPRDDSALTAALAWCHAHQATLIFGPLNVSLKTQDLGTISSTDLVEAVEAARAILKEKR
jgi:hypothetical protein